MVQVPLRAVMAIVPAFILAFALRIGATALLRLYTSNVAHPVYIETLDLAEVSIGSAPDENTPQAKSVADMASMDTFYLIGAVAWDRPCLAGGQWYYEVEIKETKPDDPGYRLYTTFLARINQDAPEPLETGGRRLPIGRWLPLEDPDGETKKLYSLDIKDHYAGMLGDYGLLITEGEFLTQHPVYRILEIGSGVLLLVFFGCFALFFERKGWF